MPRSHRTRCRCFALASPRAVSRPTRAAPDQVRPRTISSLAGKLAADGVHLSWQRPATYVNGQRMDDLGGFVVFRGVPDQQAEQIADVPVTRSRPLPPGEELRVRRQARDEGRAYYYRVISYTTRPVLQPRLAIMVDGRRSTSHEPLPLPARRALAPRTCRSRRSPPRSARRCYVYSLATLRRHYRVFDEAFAAAPHLVCFSVKANSNLAVLRTFAREGSGFDIVSGGELFRALRAGADPRKIVFSGVGKTRDEMAHALRAGILDVQRRVGRRARRCSTRVAARGRRAGAGRAARQPRRRPEDPSLHLDRDEEEQVRHRHPAARSSDYERARSLPHLDVVGVDCHIGSQLTDVSPFVDALARVRALVARPARPRLRHPLPRHRRRPRHHLRRRAAADADRVRGRGARRRHREARRHADPRARPRPRRQRRHPAHAGALPEGDRRRRTS